MDLPSKYQINEEVSVFIDNKVYKATINAVLFQEDSVRYDVLVGGWMYYSDFEEHELSKPRRWRVRVR
tara:strand:+ start:101 stop:304 length:204 start_codon:yes stop_codon:yes gene_type:complete